MTVNNYEKGYVYWVGAGVDETVTTDVIAQVIEKAGLTSHQTVDRLERIERGDTVWYLNHTSHPQTVGFRTLAPYSVISTQSDE